MMHHLTENDAAHVPTAKNMRFGIVASEWNHKVTDDLTRGAHDTLLKYGAKEENILIRRVPGSFELIFGASQMQKSGKVDAVIAIGCVIRGDTPHFDYICQGTTQGLAELNARFDIPVVYGLLTCNNLQQAQDRSGGMLGNKGDECAVTAIKMIAFKRDLQPSAQE